jgi:hypothetical protein
MKNWDLIYPSAYAIQAVNPLGLLSAHAKRLPI